MGKKIPDFRLEMNFASQLINPQPRSRAM